MTRERIRTLAGAFALAILRRRLPIPLWFVGIRP